MKDERTMDDRTVFVICFLLFFVLLPSSFFPRGVFAQESSVIHDTLDSFDDAFADLKAERDALRQEIENLKTEQRALIDGAKHRIEDAEEQKDKTSEELEAAKSKIMELQGQRENLAEKLEDTSLVTKRVQESAEDKVSSLAALRQENEQLTSRWNEAERALEKAAARIQKLQTEKESVEAELETLRQERKKILFGYDDELASIKFQRQELMSKLEAAESRLKTAELKAAGADKREEELAKEHKAELVKAAQAQKAVEEKWGEAGRQTQILKRQHREEIERFIEKAKGAERKIKDLEDQYKLGHQRAALLEEKLKFHESAAAALEREKADLIRTQKDDVEAHGKLLNDAREKLKAADEKNKFADDKLRFSEEKLKSVEEKFSLAQKDMKESAAKTAELEAALKALEEKLKVAEQKFASAKENAAFYEGRFNSLQEKFTSTEKQLQSLGGERLRQEEVLKTREERLGIVEKQLKDAQEKLSQMASEREVLTKNYQEVTEKLKGDLKTIEDKLKASQLDLSTTQSQLEAAGEKTKAAELKLQKSAEEAQNLLKEREKEQPELAALKEAGARDQTQIEALKKQLDITSSEAKREKDTLWSELEALKAKNTTLEEGRGFLEMNHRQVQEKLDAAVKDLAAVENLRVESMKLSERLKTENAGLNEAWKQAQDQLKAKEERLAAAEAAVKDGQERLSVLEGRLASASTFTDGAVGKYQAEAAGLNDRLKALLEENAALKKEREALAKKVDELTARILEDSRSVAKSAAIEKENRFLKSGMDKLVKKLQEAESQSQQASQSFEKDRARQESLAKDYEENIALIDQAKNLKGQNEGLLERVKEEDAKFKKLMESFIKIQQENDQLKEDAKAHINPREFAETKHRNNTLEKENADLKKDLKQISEAYTALKGEHEETAKEAILQQQAVKRMGVHLEEWNQEKQQWVKSEEEKKEVLTKKTEEGVALRGELRKALEENRRLQKQLESFPNDLSAMNAKTKKAESENAMLHYNLGVIYTEKESYEEAIDEFQKALEVNPDDPYAHYNLGIIYSQFLIDEEKAVRHFKAYLKKSPNDRDADRARRYLFTRETYEAEGKK